MDEKKTAEAVYEQCGCGRLVSTGTTKPAPTDADICRREAFRLRPLSQGAAIRLQLLVLPSAQCGVGPVLALVSMALDQSVGRIQLRSTPGALGGGHLFG